MRLKGKILHIGVLGIVFLYRERRLKLPRSQIKERLELGPAVISIPAWLARVKEIGERIR